MGRRLKFNIFRYNPLDYDSSPHTDTFFLDETDSMTPLYCPNGGSGRRRIRLFSSISAAGPGFVDHAQ